MRQLFNPREPRYRRFVLGGARLLGLSIVAVGLGVGCTFGGSPTRKLAVEATRGTWLDGSPVESGGLNYPTDIYVVDVKSRHVRNITKDERTEYSWSWLPDGRRILFASVPNDRMQNGPSHIFIVDADGRNRRQLTSGAGEVSPELAPDGRRLLFVGQGARQRGLYVMHVDGSHKKRLTQSRESPYESSWSPNAKQIVFVRQFPPIRYVTPRSNIFVINADGTGLRRLTRTKTEESTPTWSPDGEKIAFIRSVDPWDLVYVMRSDGTSVTKLTPSGHNSGVSWLSHDRVVYYNADEDRWWSIDAGGTKKRQPFRRTRIGNHLRDRHAREVAVLSPDGKWIAFDMGQHRIWVARADGTHRRLVTRRICCFYFTIDWAPK